MKDFRDLKVWTEAHWLTLEIYRTTANFPRDEIYGLRSQILRCSVSIGANIAEGCGKRGNNEFQRFLQIAAGSAANWTITYCSRTIWDFSPIRTTANAVPNCCT
jgi:four helix bundle protein